MDMDKRLEKRERESSKWVGDVDMWPEKNLEDEEDAGWGCSLTWSSVPLSE